MLNGKGPTLMVFDTGAGPTILPAAVAAQSNLKPTGRTVSCVVADGTTVMAEEMIIRSVTVGRLTVKDVTCVVMPADKGNIARWSTRLLTATSTACRIAWKSARTPSRRHRRVLESGSGIRQRLAPRPLARGAHTRHEAAEPRAADVAALARSPGSPRCAAANPFSRLARGAQPRR
jgi:Aspartyl protease